MEKIVGGFVALVVFGIVFAVILAWPTMLLWNWLCPTLFDLPAISFWQALGLCILARFLFPSGGTSSK